MKKNITTVFLGLLLAANFANAQKKIDCRKLSPSQLRIVDRETECLDPDKLYAAEQKKIAEELKKKGGVSIGMNQDDVLKSSWGKPKKVNRTTNAYGTSEQWVYGGHNYLYFKDGILTSIQN